MSKPIKDRIKRLRQRIRSDGSWRIWWEPEAAIKALGFTTTELDDKRLTWSIREAARLNADVETTRDTGNMPRRGAGDRSMVALIRNYKSSRGFTKLATKTQSSYRSNLSLIERKWGEVTVTEFTKPIVHTWYEANYTQRGPTQALALNRMLSILFEFAERTGWRDEGTNPAHKIRAESPKGRERHLTWEESDALIDAAEQLRWHNMALAIGLSLYQGQRATDVRLAAPADFTAHNTLKNNTLTNTIIWTLTRSKRGNSGTLPIHAEIAAKLSQALQARPETAQTLILDETTGAPYDEHLFGKRFRTVRDHAAKNVPSLRDVQFRDLRRTFAVRSRQGGATKDDAADVLGNSAATNPRLAETYMPTQLATTTRAVEAVQRPIKEK